MIYLRRCLAWLQTHEASERLPKAPGILLFPAGVTHHQYERLLSTDFLFLFFPSPPIHSLPSLFSVSTCSSSISSSPSHSHRHSLLSLPPTYLLSSNNLPFFSHSLHYPLIFCLNIYLPSCYELLPLFIILIPTVLTAKPKMSIRPAAAAACTTAASQPSQTHSCSLSCSINPRLAFFTLRHTGLNGMYGLG